ncbi:unnamed protein product [Miscanthus lutarioriparius]|uniref:Anthocyanidin reductase n=1 Tax=Miscanthus lutarioriparius TaxID=422564 RepID=A0A811R0F4_9POAL|nr:unnamed protein product [Miscanthus lutarioriparius]
MSSSVGDMKKKMACVTGGNGYMGSALIKMLLEEGYAVKTTVRNPDDMEKNSHLKGLQELGPLTVLRADMDEEGSLDDAVAGCDYVFLVTAPVNLWAQDPEKEQIEPSIRGTLNAMRSCVKAGTVRRVILTSSVAGVYIRPDLQGDGHVLDEASWSDVEYLRANKPPTWAHCVSKVLLEKEACRFAEEHGISLVTVLPVIVVGAAPAPKARSSIVDCLSLLSGDEAGLAMLKGIQKNSGQVQLVHVDDLCRAELFLAEEAAADGRYICSSLGTTLVELARFLAQKYPQYGVKTNFTNDDQLLEKPRVSLSSAKLVKEGLEFKYKTLDEIYENRGSTPAPMPQVESATASEGPAPPQDAWVIEFRRLLPRWESLRDSSKVIIPISISRVNQFDAARLDVEMSAMLKEQLLKVFSLVKPGLLFQYEPELDAFLEFLIWRFSIWVDKPTPGNALMNLRYVLPIRFCGGRYGYKEAAALSFIAQASDAHMISGFDPPPARVFAWRVLELKEQGVREDDAMAVADYRTQKKAKKRAYKELKEIARSEGKKPPPNPYPSAIKEIQAEEKKYVMDHLFNPKVIEIANKMKEERDKLRQDRAAGQW